MPSRGFSLLEVVIAVAILCTVCLGVAQLLAAAVRATTLARVQTTTSALASARLEQLRSLAFEFDGDGQRVMDVRTNVATEPAGQDGPGLAGAGTDSLIRTVHGFVDYLDAQGRWVGGSTAAPPGAAFVRRWSIDVMPGSTDLLVIQVLVRSIGSDRQSAAASRATPGESRLTTVLARSAR